MTTEPATEPTFEDALRRLEQVVDDLERGEGGLSQALARYEEGVRLLSHCQGVLEKAERSVALLTGVDDAGAAVTAPFDASATAGETASPTSSRTRKAPKAAKADGGEDGVPF